MEKDLKTAFREIFFSYGAALLESEQLVNYLSDWQIGIDKPTKNVVRAIVNQGYGKKILDKAKVGELKFSDSKYLAKEIGNETGFMPELVKKVVESIFYGLNVVEERIGIIENANASLRPKINVASSSIAPSVNTLNHVPAKAKNTQNFTIQDIIASGYKPAGKLTVNPNTNEIYDVYFTGLGCMEMNLVYKEVDKFHRKEFSKIFWNSIIWPQLIKGDLSVIRNVEYIDGYCSIIHTSLCESLLNRNGIQYSLSEILIQLQKTKKEYPSLIPWRLDKQPDKTKIWIEKNVNRNEVWIDFAGKKLMCTLSDTCDLIKLLNSDDDFELIECASNLIFVVRKSDVEYDPWIFDMNGQITNRSLPVSLSKSVLAMGHLTIDDFFPIEGMVLGKSTWGDAENLKYPIKTYSGGKYIDTKNGVTFLDYNATGIFSCLLMEDEKIPAKWNKIGIKHGMSYQSWMKWLSNNSFKINVLVDPKVVASEERNVLCALVEAIDWTNTFKISLDFNCGNKKNEGCSVTSSNSLYTIYFDILC